MRTTLTIEDDVLFAAKSLAHREGRSLGEVISDLARRALHAPVSDPTTNGTPTALDDQLAQLGLKPHRAPDVAVVMQAQIDALREAQGL